MSADPSWSATPTAVLVNARAGLRGLTTVHRLRSAADAAHLPVHLQVLDASAMGAEVDRLASAGSPTIALAGGDGTISLAANRLVGTSTALLPVPTGTFNHFARRIGFQNPEEAMEAVRPRRVETMAVGLVDDRTFLNTATFGSYAGVVRRRERLRRLLGKWPAAAIAFAATLVRPRRVELVVLVEGEYLRRSTPLLWVGLGWGSFPRVTESSERRRSPDLEIVVLRPASRRASAALLARVTRHLLRGERPVMDPDLEVIHARSIIIHASHAVEVTLDGEVTAYDPPIFVSVQDEALNVIVPAT